GEALERAEKYGFDRIVVEPMGNMPVIKDLIVDMDAVHWKKVQRVTPWLLPAEDPPEGDVYTVPAEAIVISAIERKESRGAQYRTDYPERNDDEWLRHINVSANGAEPELSYSPVTMTQWEPQERTY
ncbi:MAG TPA: hypothetical protein VFX45_10015, partial [Solirubrobacterales bacterium]|nr:hypothetical protein [Solirubrobacterales bacterium]